jgi:hypothetical protein
VLLDCELVRCHSDFACLHEVEHLRDLQDGSEVGDSELLGFHLVLLLAVARLGSQ